MSWLQKYTDENEGVEIEEVVELAEGEEPPEVSDEDAAAAAAADTKIIKDALLGGEQVATDLNNNTNTNSNITLTLEQVATHLFRSKRAHAPSISCC